jgi:hypothetical protein
MTYRLQKGPRELPCCRTSVRVKIIEPGVQHRRCELCKSTNYFILEEMKLMPGTLKMRWVSTREASDWLEAVHADESLARGVEL